MFSNPSLYGTIARLLPLLLGWAEPTELVKLKASVNPSMSLHMERPPKDKKTPRARSPRGIKLQESPVV
jgi:hypothetical protein